MNDFIRLPFIGQTVASQERANPEEGLVSEEAARMRTWDLAYVPGEGNMSRS
jgi:hypothetical protein